MILFSIGVYPRSSAANIGFSTFFETLAGPGRAWLCPGFRAGCPVI
jgi:hypothetical protein